MSGQIKSLSSVSIIEQWALWARTERGPMGYKSQLLAIMQDNVEQRARTRMSMHITDDQGLAIDGAMCQLEGANHMAARCLWLYYLRGLTFIEIAENISCSRKMAAQLHDQGVMWMDGYAAGCEQLLKIA